MDAIIEGFSLLLELENIILITLGVLIGVLVERSLGSARRWLSPS